MKKIIVLSIAVLLVLVGCASVTPEDAFETAKENTETSAQTIDFVVASVLTTEDGEVPFDNMGTIRKEASDEFEGIVEAKVELDDEYEDVIVYAPENDFVIELDGNQSSASLEEVLNQLEIVNFTELNALVSDFDDVTTEDEVFIYTKESTDLADVLSFSTHGELRDLTFKEGNMTQTLTVEKEVLQENQIYIESIYSDEEGKDYPVTQNITLNYSEGSDIEMPEFN